CTLLVSHRCCLILFLASSTFFFSSYGDHRDLHSFPTRRSSDLISASHAAGDGTRRGVPRAGNPRGMVSPSRPSARRDLVAERNRSEEHTSELQSRGHLVCRLLLEKKKKKAWSLRCRY